MRMFATPKMDDLKSAVALQQAVDAIIKNPKVFREAAEEQMAAHTLTEEQKAKYETALKTIEEAKTLSEKVQYEKKQHDENVKQHEKNVGAFTVEVEQANKSIADQRKTFAEETKKIALELQTEKAKVATASSATAQKEQELIAKGIALDSIKKEHDKRELAIQTKEIKLNSELEKLAAKKKKFLDAAKED